MKSEALQSKDSTPKGPNDLWTIDFKCQWYHRGRQAEPMIVRDEFSRFVLEAILPPDSATETIKEIFESLFKRYGLPGRIRSETASPFGASRGLLGLSKLSAWWLALGIDLEWKRQGMDQGTGVFERPYLAMNRQWDPVSFAERQAELDAWRLNFNEQRPHKAISMQVPSAVYTSSSKLFSGTPDALEYPGLDCRKAAIAGSITFNAGEYFLSKALAGWDIGLRPLSDGRVEVNFAALSLGIIDPKLHEFLPASLDLLVRVPETTA